MRFTASTAARLTLDEGKSERIEFDDTMAGFGIRIREGGSRRWVVQYGLGAKQRRVTLGNAASMPLAQARKAAGDVLAAVRLGRDPAGERDAGRAKAGLTLEAVATRFLARQEKRLRTKTYVGLAYYLNTLFRPLHGLTLDKIGRAAVAERLAAIADDNGPTAADRARAALSSLYSWAMREGLCEANPTVATNRHSEGRARDRVLSDAELRTIWPHLADDDFGRIVRLLALTGQRREEIAALRWCEIDMQRRLIALPGARTKNKQAHDVPLSDAAFAIIDAIPRRANRDLVFGEGRGGFSGWSKATKALHARMAKVGDTLAHWTVHDLRRTFSTGANDLGVQPHIVEAATNHISGAKAGVAGVYNRATYATEKRKALDMWGAHVMAVVEGRASNVVTLKPKTA